MSWPRKQDMNEQFLLVASRFFGDFIDSISTTQPHVMFNSTPDYTMEICTHSSVRINVMNSYSLSLCVVCPSRQDNGMERLTDGCDWIKQKFSHCKGREQKKKHLIVIIVLMYFLFFFLFFVFSFQVSLVVCKHTIWN